MLTKRIKGIPEALQGLVPHVVTLQQPRRSRGWLGSLALLWVAQASLLSGFGLGLTPKLPGGVSMSWAEVWSSAGSLSSHTGLALTQTSPPRAE